MLPSLVPKPHPREEGLVMLIRPIPWASLTLTTFGGEFSIHQSLHKAQPVFATPEILGYFRTMTQDFFFWRVKLLTMHTTSHELIIKPKESAECHQTLS